MKLSVIIPVYNEVDTVCNVIDQVKTCGVTDLEIVVVDDCSSDNTGERLKAFADDPIVRVLTHPENRGKGAAIRSAQSVVTGDVVVVQDADLEYSPEEFPRMLALIEQDRAEVVYGSRYSGREILVDTFWHYLGNKLLTTFSNICSNTHLTDMETCYKMIRADIFKQITITCDRFGIEPEVTAKLAKRRCRIFEVPISYRARAYDAGKKIGWQDGLAALWYVVKFNLLQ